MLFSLLKHYLDTALKVSQSVFCFTTSISHSVENYFPKLWGTGISDAIFCQFMIELTPGFIYKSFCPCKINIGVLCYKLLFCNTVKPLLSDI